MHVAKIERKNRTAKRFREKLVCDKKSKLFKSTSVFSRLLRPEDVIFFDNFDKSFASIP